MRTWISAICLTLLLLGAASQPASATAIASGSPNAGLNFTNRGAGSLDALAYTATLLEQYTFTSFEGNASATAFAGGVAAQGALHGNKSGIASGINLGVSAVAAGHAIAEARKIVHFELVNTSGEEIIFDVAGYFGVNTGVRVSNILAESVLASWSTFVRVGSYEYGSGRTIDCSYPPSPPSACPNFYDSSDDMGGRRFALDPGETLEFTITTTARYEATAVPEPSTLALFATAGLGFLAIGRRRARACEANAA